MTTQLRDSRGQIDQFTRNLQQAVQELERRANSWKPFESILLPSFPDADARIVPTNSPSRYLRPDARKPKRSTIFSAPNPRALYKTHAPLLSHGLSSP